LQYKKGADVSKAIDLLKQGMFTVDPLGMTEQKFQTPENFKQHIERYYAEGKRIFFFDHLHEVTGMNINDTNQAVSEQWANYCKTICQQHPDIWLFIFAQPNGAAAEKILIRREDIAGSKAITHKIDYFLSLNKKQQKVKDIEEHIDKNGDREIVLWIDKNRNTEEVNVGFRLFHSLTGNFVEFPNEDVQQDEKLTYSKKTPIPAKEQEPAKNQSVLKNQFENYEIPKLLENI
jgi:hypothetical protein